VDDIGGGEVRLLSELEVIESTYKMFKNYTKVGHLDATFVAIYLSKLLQEYGEKSEVKNVKEECEIDTDSW
jgi:hypothetical protein